MHFRNQLQQLPSILYYQQEISNTPLLHAEAYSRAIC